MSAGSRYNEGDHGGEVMKSGRIIQQYMMTTTKQERSVDLGRASNARI